ncbi:AAA family ATPase [Demequina sp. NBRC 110055]|uniref:ATP-binding protein n=1 Tax=Demequina sp. NBRC 110055 TaxID=1570344 RepID=UPI000A03AAB7|nr:LuxR family transcriptional regulator [Demequina sp. NBRC 110055]
MIVEREDHLTQLASLREAATRGAGAFVLVAGEAGQGKTTLVREFLTHGYEGCRVRVGGADNVTTADALAAFQEAVPEIADDVAAVQAGALSRYTLHTRLRATLTREPTAMVLEDMHWADDATLNALQFLGRRSETAPLMVIATFRPDDIGPSHPLTQLLDEAARWPHTTRIDVPALTVDGVATLVAHARSVTDAATLHARTAGNAFYVTEVLATSGSTLPTGVADAVRARLARLSPDARVAAEAAAVVGDSAPADLMAAVAGCSLDAIDECVERGMLVVRDSGVAYRHELAREAVEAAVTAPQARRLHRAALTEVQRRTPEDHRRIAHHAAQCGEATVAAHHAAIAGRHLAALGAHREAATQLRAALRHGPPANDRAGLYVELSHECYLTDQLLEALTARHHALEFHAAANEAMEVGDDQRWLSRLSWFLGRGADAERFAQDACHTLEPLGPSVPLAAAWSNLSQLRMLADDTEEAVRWGEQAIALASELGEDEIRIHALNNVGSAMAVSTYEPAGVARLRQSLDGALLAGFEEHAARAQTNLGSAALRHRKLPDALAQLEAGIDYTEAHDLDSWTRYMKALRADALVHVGRLDEALGVAHEVLGPQGVSPISTIPAACAAARATMLRGDDPQSYLALAQRLAAETGEIQRIGPVACAAAEYAWLDGRVHDIAAATDLAWELAQGAPDPWLLGELAWWRHLASLAATVELSSLAPPFACMLAGDGESAAREWSNVGDPIWAAYGAAAGPHGAMAHRAIAAAVAAGASAVAAALGRERARRGGNGPSSDHAGVGLTPREGEVLQLLAAGLSTPDIARELVLSRRTVEHHVSAVLQKLGEPTRARAVAAAVHRGLVDRG